MKAPPDFLPPFSCGHPRSRENMLVKAGVGYCRQCKSTKKRLALFAAAQRERPHLYTSGLS